MKTNIRILAANPKGTKPLQLDREIEFIHDELERSSQRDRFEILRGTVVARSQDLQSQLRKRKPRIVHFCGHGEKEGLFLENDEQESQLVTTETLGNVFQLFSEQIECVVLNACYTKWQAEVIAKHINFVIGMNQPISDPSAIAFSKEFYRALGDGKSIPEAFQFGRNQIVLELSNSFSDRNASITKKSREKFSEHLIPEIFIKKNLSKIKQTEEISNRDKPNNPYLGLNKFTPEDKDKFFGRKQLSIDLSNGLIQDNWLLLLGASGSGKSSLVQAGIIPRLFEKLGASDLNKLIFVPDQNPFQSLCNSLPESHKKAFREIINKQNNDILIELIDKLKENSSQWIIFIDQFEEIFTVTSKLKRKQFIANLISLMDRQNSSVKVIMAMRSDFMNNLSKYGDFNNKLQRKQWHLSDMTEPELKLAITEPAARNGVTFENGLVEQIISDFFQQAGSLPLLQYTLDLLWENGVSNDNRVLNMETYKNLGGVRAALQKRADHIYHKLSKEEQIAVKEIFIKLIRLKDLEVKEPVSKRVEKSKLIGNNPDKESALDKLIEHRFLVSGREREKENTVEVAHEELLRSWKIIQDLIKENQEILVLKSRLMSDANQWYALQKEEREKAVDELWSGYKIERVCQLRDNEALGSLDKITEQFIEASRKRNQDLLREKKEQIKELERLLTEANLREQAGKVSDLISLYPVEALRLAIQTTCESAEKLAGEVLNPVLDSLLWTLSMVRERNRYRHEFEVNSVAFAPNGKAIVSGSQDGTLRLWDLQGNLLKQLFKAHNHVVSSIAFSRDGNTIISGSHDGTIGLWNLHLEPVGTPFKGHEDWIYSVAISPNGQVIATGSHDTTVRLWDLQGNAIGQPFQGHDSPVCCVAFSHDGNTIISGSNDGVLGIWNLQGKQIAKLAPEQISLINSIAISPDGKLAVSVGFEGMLCLWDLQKHEVKRSFRIGSKVTALAFSPNGQLIISGNNSTVCLWDLNGNPIGFPFRGHEGRINSVAFSPEAPWIVSGSADKTLRLWTLENNLFRKQQFLGHKEKVNSVAISPDGKFIVSGSDDKTVRLWNLQGNPISPPFIGHLEQVKSVAFSPDGKFIVSGSDDKTIRLWNLQGNPISSLIGHLEQVNSVAFSPDGKFIVSGSDDKTVRLWDLQGNVVGQFQGHEDIVNSVAFSPDGKFIVSGSGDATLRLWDLQSNPISSPFQGHQGQIKSVAFSPDGKSIASGSDDRTIRLWDLQGNVVGQPFKGHKGWVTAVTFSPDGKFIVSGSYDRTIRLWDLQGNPIGPPFQGHGEMISSIAVSPDGKFIVSGSYDKTVLLWQGHNWKTCLQIAWNLLSDHSLVAQRNSEEAIELHEMCKKYVEHQL